MKNIEINISNKSDIAKRLYVITGLSINPVGTGYGSIVMRHHQEARMAKDVKVTKGPYKSNDSYRGSIFLYHTQFNYHKDFSLWKNLKSYFLYSRQKMKYQIGLSFV